jgi:hypothetical protein
VETSLPPNPYTPGSTPRYLAGRDTELERVRQYLAPVIAYGEMAGPQLVFHGPRGVGKTSLLRAAEASARESGFVTAWTSCVRKQPFLADLAGVVSRALDRAGVDTATPRWRARVEKVGVEVGLSGPRVSAELGREEPGEVVPGSVTAVEDLLHEAARAVRDRGGAGLLVLVDELHAAARLDLAILLNAVQNLDGERDRNPLAVVCAGLPSVRGVLTRAATFGERSHWAGLGGLDDRAAAEVLTHLAGSQDVSWEPEAVAVCVAQAQGYPYFLQVLGSATWNAARPEAGSTLTLADARAGISAAEEQVRSMYAARWQAATPLEKVFLAAMADLGGDGPVARGDIAAAMGRPTSSIGMLRNQLLDKAIIEESSRGELRFTLPGFADYVLSEEGSATT